VQEVTVSDNTCTRVILCVCVCVCVCRCIRVTLKSILTYWCTCELILISQFHGQLQAEINELRSAHASLRASHNLLVQEVHELRHGHASGHERTSAHSTQHGLDVAMRADSVQLQTASSRHPVLTATTSSAARDTRGRSSRADVPEPPPHDADVLQTRSAAYASADHDAAPDAFVNGLQGAPLPLGTIAVASGTSSSANTTSSHVHVTQMHARADPDLGAREWDAFEWDAFEQVV
jgi:hypothetical protein